MPLSDVCMLVERLGPYHHARLKAAGKVLRVTALELFKTDRTYAWEEVPGSAGFERVTLFAHEEEARPAGLLKERIWRALERCAPRAVAVNGWWDRSALAALRWCLKSGTPAILLSESQVCDADRAGWKEAVKRLIVKGFSSALVGGESHARYLQALGMERPGIFTGYDAVDNAHFSRGADEARFNTLALRRERQLDGPYFLASNRFIEKKNLPRLVEAYALYRETAGSAAWPLVILGDGPLRPSLEAQVEKLGLDRLVRLPGFKQYGELPGWYGLAGAFIHASTREQWGLVVNEAMAAGLPVLVSSQCGCCGDLVEEGVNGYSFDPFDTAGLADKMLLLAGGGSGGGCDLAAMGRASRARVGRYSPENFALSLAQALAQAAAPASARSALHRLWLPGLLRLR